MFFNGSFFTQPSINYLFNKLNKSEVHLTGSEKSKLLIALDREINTQEYDIVTFNDLNGLTKKEEIRINLGKNGDVILYYKSKTEDILGNTTYVYKADYQSYAIITISNSKVYAFFQLGNEVFNIEPLGNKNYLLTKVDNEKAINIVKHEKDYNEKFKVNVGPIDLHKTDGTYSVEGFIVVDLLVAYTPAAASAAGNISSLISQAIAQANTTYDNSGINVLLNLAYATQVSYTESGSTETDCNRFAGTNDSYMDGIHSLRTQYNADACVLITVNGDDAGWAQSITADYSTAFCAVRYDYAVNQISFTHEIGHLQGARHQFKIDNGVPLYAHGYYHYDSNLNNRWRTVMAIYDAKYGNTLNRIPYWSDPNTYYNGSVLGITDTANNRYRLNYTAYTIASLSEPVNISGTVTVNTIITGNVNLIDDVTVNSGITLTIDPSATVDLNGYSTTTSSGTITIQSGATINGLAAKLKNMYSSTYKGYCGTVQAAINNAGYLDEVYIQSGTYSENLSISGKSGLYIYGGVINGSITATNSPGLSIAGTECSSLYLNNCTFPVFSSLNIFGSGSGTGLSLYNTGQNPGNMANMTIWNHSTGFYAYSSWCYSNSGMLFYDHDNGVVSSYNSVITLDEDQLCGISGYHLTAGYSGYLYAYNCQYDNGTPSIFESNNGDVVVNGAYACSMGKRSGVSSSNVSEITYNNVLNEEFTKINSQLNDLSNRVSKDISEKKGFDNKKFSKEYIDLTNKFKRLIEKDPSSNLNGAALTAAVHCFKRIEDYESMKDFLQGIKKESNISGLAKRFMIDYYLEQKDYTTAISIADQLIKETKSDANQTIDALYAKGLILAHELKEFSKAAECFNEIIKSYPDNPMVDMTRNQLMLLGYEISKEEKEEITVNNKSELSIGNYPNPFNPSTTISYTLPADGKVQIKIFDVLGREVTTLIDNFISKGAHTVEWNGSDYASGIYFYTITFQNQMLNRKMLLIK